MNVLDIIKEELATWTVYKIHVKAGLVGKAKITELINRIRSFEGVMTVSFKLKAGAYYILIKFILAPGQSSTEYVSSVLMPRIAKISNLHVRSRSKVIDVDRTVS